MPRSRISHRLDQGNGISVDSGALVECMGARQKIRGIETRMLRTESSAAISTPEAVSVIIHPRNAKFH